MLDLVTPLQDIANLQLDARKALTCGDNQSVIDTLDKIQDICDETLTAIHRLVLLAGTGKEAKT